MRGIDLIANRAEETTRRHVDISWHLLVLSSDDLDIVRVDVHGDEL